MIQIHTNTYLGTTSRTCIDLAIKFIHDLYKETNPDQHLDWLYTILHHQGNVTEKIIQIQHSTQEPELKDKLKKQFNLFSDLYNHRYKSQLLIETFNKELAETIVNYQNIHPTILSKSEQQKQIRKLLYIKTGTLHIKQETTTKNPVNQLKIDIHPLYQTLHTLYHLHKYKFTFTYNEDIRPSQYTVIEPRLAQLHHKNTKAAYETEEDGSITITGHSAVLGSIYQVFETLLHTEKHDTRIDVLANAPTRFADLYQQINNLNISNTSKQKIDLQLRKSLFRISGLLHEKHITNLPTYKPQ
ncbi:hypothetical protein GO495_06565 [Chitinophaga oryziterrae]|uniref:Uncharacterized protein n=1 Tax=Chitinophaga oryziterrae TaxID=1031224 RepID=A0A6N8J4T4_9BACT|nr:hypothetical protein [Chitinophaga oryziterrae]MVT40237.1 hypothetical protein [Chitinophaga oryziterrae]